MKRKLLVLLMSALLLFPNMIYAWGREGHHMVVEIAYQLLSKSSQEKLMSYLGNTSLDDASTWMDEQRGNNKFRYLTTTHYLNIDKGGSFNPFQKNNIYTEINEVLNDLEKTNTTSPDDIKQDLMILIHLIGDLHQPLHVGYGNDKGGNEIHVSLFGSSTNLHSAWDGGIINREGITTQKILPLYSKLSASEILQIKTVDLKNWVMDSRKPLDFVYSFQNGNLDEQYAQKATPIIENQILKAGIRLSVLLEKVLGDKKVNTIQPVVIPQATAQKSISAAETVNHMGETITVCDKVFGTKYLESSSSAPTFLNMGAAYPNSPFSVVIFGSNRPNFKEKPELYYDYKKVCVTGTIKEYKGKPEMIISNESEIRIEN